MVYGLVGLHDFASGALLTMLLVAALRSRGTAISMYALASVSVVTFTLLPLPPHGTPLYAFASVLATFLYFRGAWGSDELGVFEQRLVLGALLLLMLNAAIGLHLSGRI